MKTSRCNIRVCSVRLQRCDLDRSKDAGALRAEGATSTRPRVPASSTTPQDDNKMAIPVIKTEFDDENAVSMETPKVQLMPQGHLPYIGLSLKKENDCIVETENNKMDEITIKQELDIGPTVLQLKTMSWPIPPAQVSSHVNLPDPYLSTDFGNRAVSPQYCMTLGQHALQKKIKADYGEEDSGALSIANCIQDESKTDHTARVLMEHSYHQSIEFGEPLLRTKMKDDYCKEGSGVLSIANCEQHSARVLMEHCYHCHIIKGGRDHISQLGDLKACVRTHTRRGPCKCERCERSAYQYNNSEKLMRINTRVKPYKCEWCEYRSRNVSHLKLHMRIHRDYKPCKFDQCENSATQPCFLKKHNGIHTNVKRYKCKQCGFRVSEQHNLKTHMLTHMADKPYKCEQCEYSARHTSHLKIHMRIHSGEKFYKRERQAPQLHSFKMQRCPNTGGKPYLCMQCEFSTHRFDVLKRHKWIHMSEKRYKCEQCEYSTGRLDAFKIHTHTHTSKNHCGHEQCKYDAF